jgi:hypothetical protein
MTSDNIFSSESLNDDKADEICFVGGKYVSKTGGYVNLSGTVVLTRLMFWWTWEGAR